MSYDKNSPFDDNQYIMYHGTTKTAAVSILRYGFQKSQEGLLGPGIYCTRDIRKAYRYGPTILKLVVNVGTIYPVRYIDDPLRTDWKKHGFDSAFADENSHLKKFQVKNGCFEEFCIWSPRQVRVHKISKGQSWVWPKEFLNGAS